jgi:hypothetical protein
LEAAPELLKRDNLAIACLQPTTTEIGTGKGSPFRKTKQDGDAGFSSANKEKPGNFQYVSVEIAHRLFEENLPVPWPDAGLPSDGWYLNHLHVSLPPLLHEGRQRRYEIHHRRFILQPDQHDDPTFTLDSYKWSTFGTWESNSRRQASYLGDVDFFNQERRVRFDNKEEDEKGALEEKDELQPPNLTEDEAMEMAIINREFDDLAQWDDLANCGPSH